jgi:hypothetical protein
MPFAPAFTAASTTAPAFAIVVFALIVVEAA